MPVVLDYRHSSSKSEDFEQQKKSSDFEQQILAFNLFPFRIHPSALRILSPFRISSPIHQLHLCHRTKQIDPAGSYFGTFKAFAQLLVLAENTPVF